jgi:cytochrome c biogenesis protein CcdA
LIPELLAAAAVGISFANAWMCIGLSFGTRGESAAVGARFIAGRVLGLVLIGTAISSVGAIMEIPPIYFVAIFAAGSILFGILMLVGIFGGPGPLKRRLRHALGLQRGNGTGCEGADPARGEGGAMKESGLRPTGAFLLGVMRGATPCVKLMVLAPLLIAVGPLWAVALSLVYALASSAYPIIGFLLASSASYLPRHERAVKVAGAAVMIIIGAYMIVNESLLYASPRGD